MVDLSIVVPVYRCEECLGALYDRATRAVAEITPSYEIVFVDGRIYDAAQPSLRGDLEVAPREAP